MALLSKPLLSLKLSSLPLLLVVLVAWIFSETKAFQSKFGPIFFGASSASLCSSNKAARDGSFVQGVGENDEKEEELLEEENPEANFDRQSLSGVRYGSVFDSLSVLYPPTDLEKRNAVSRSDGYWPYINSGEEPPKQFTYGEFDLYFFAELLDRALDYYNENQHVKSTNWDGKVFTDVGSGTGRLVFAAAALHPGWKLCRGVEVLQGIHDVAIETLDKCRHEIDVPVGSEEDVNVNIKAKQESVDIVEGHEESNGESNVGTTTWKTFGTPFAAPQNDNDWLEKLREQYDDTAPAQDDVINTSDDDDVEGEDENLSPSEDEEITQEQEPSGSFEMYILPTSKDTETSEDEMLCVAPIEFVCGSFDDPYEYIGDSDLIFVFSSCMSSDMMTRLSKAFGRQCKPGTIIITTDYSLPLSGDIEPLEDDENMPFGPFKLEMLESIDGWCWLTGGRSTAHIHRVVSSLWEEGVGPRQKPEIPLEEQAWRVVQAYEAGELTDTNKFLREVRNSMIFAGLPESWLPSIDDDE